MGTGKWPLVTRLVQPRSHPTVVSGSPLPSSSPLVDFRSSLRSKMVLAGPQYSTIHSVTSCWYVAIPSLMYCPILTFAPGLVDLHHYPFDRHPSLDRRLLPALLHVGPGILASWHRLPPTWRGGRSVHPSHQGRWPFRSSGRFPGVVQRPGGYPRHI